MEEMCKQLNRLHRVVWTAIAVMVMIGAMIWNYGHLVTAALILLFSRAEWEVSDLKALR